MEKGPLHTSLNKAIEELHLSLRARDALIFSRDLKIIVSDIIQPSESHADDSVPYNSRSCGALNPHSAEPRRYFPGVCPAISQIPSRPSPPGRLRCQKMSNGPPCRIGGRPAVCSHKTAAADDVFCLGTMTSRMPRGGCRIGEFVMPFPVWGMIGRTGHRCVSACVGFGPCLCLRAGSYTGRR